MILYFAAPLFSTAELEFNARLTEKIEDLGYKVFLPQRDGDKIIYSEPIVSMEPQDRAREIFHLDKKNLFESDVFLYVLDGRIPDEGAAVALGMAHLHTKLTDKKRLLVGLHTDKRAAFIDEKLNPMIYTPLDYIADSVEDLLEYLENHIA